MSLRLGAMLLLAATAALVISCGGGSERSLSEGNTSPSPSRTSPIFQRSPAAGSPTQSAGASPTASPAGTPAPTATGAATSPEVNVTPVSQPYDVTVDEAVNIRSRPSTAAEPPVGAIYQGEKAKVVGEARGQEVEPGKGDLWYQIELTRNGSTITGFVWAPLVKKV